MKVPPVKSRPRHAATRGDAPSHSSMSVAGQRKASGHAPTGANASARSAPAGSASHCPRRAMKSSNGSVGRGPGVPVLEGSRTATGERA